MNTQTPADLSHLRTALADAQAHWEALHVEARRIRDQLTLADRNAKLARKVYDRAMLAYVEAAEAMEDGQS